MKNYLIFHIFSVKILNNSNTHTTKVGGIACFYYRKIYESLTFNYVGLFLLKLVNKLDYLK